MKTTFIYYYCQQRITWILLAIYALVGIVLNILFHINILPPCLWKTLFNVECPGCGLTRAFISLFQLDFRAAWEWNKLCFIIAPAFIYYFIQDIRQVKINWEAKSNFKNIS